MTSSVRAAGETGWVDVWQPGAPGWIARDVMELPQVEWLLREERLVQMAHAAPRRIRVIAAMPGYGHEGFHPDGGPDEDAVAFFVMLSPFGGDAGTIRALPGSHRNPPDFGDEIGSAMPPHPDEERIDADPGDLFVYSARLWKSSTFNGGDTPRKGLWIG